MSFHIHRPLDDAWLYDSDDSNSYGSYGDEDDSEPDSEPGSSNDMPLPPENFYTTEDEMWTSIQAWAAQHKYAFRVSRSKPIGDNRKKILYQCDCCRPMPAENHLQDDP